jgi:hypothetical protein
MGLQLKDDTFRGGDGYRQFHDEKRLSSKREKVFEDEKKRELLRKNDGELLVTSLNYGNTRTTLEFNHFK